MRKFSRRPGRCRTLLFRNGRANSKRLQATFLEGETSSLNHKTRLQSFSGFLGAIASVNGTRRTPGCSRRGIPNSPCANKQFCSLKWSEQNILEYLATHVQKFFCSFFRGIRS